jgi:hypothetical protein
MYDQSLSMARSSTTVVISPIQSLESMQDRAIVSEDGSRRMVTVVSVIGGTVQPNVARISLADIYTDDFCSTNAWKNRLLQSLLVLLSFGLACPYLAVVLVATTLVEFKLRSLVIGKGRWLTRWGAISSSMTVTVSSIREQDQSPVQSVILSKLAQWLRPHIKHSIIFECSVETAKDFVDQQIDKFAVTEWEGLQASLITTIMVSSGFIAAISYDIVGNEFGHESALEACLLVLFMIPLCIYLTALIINVVVTKRLVDKSSGHQSAIDLIKEQSQWSVMSNLWVSPVRQKDSERGSRQVEMSSAVGDHRKNDSSRVDSNSRSPNETGKHLSLQRIYSDHEVSTNSVFTMERASSVL